MNVAARLCSQAPPGGGILCSMQILEVIQRNTFFRSASAQDATQLVPEPRGAGEAVHLRSMPPLLPPPSPDDCAQPASISAAADTDLSGSTSESTRGQGCGGHVLALGESFTSSLPVGSVRSGCSLDISVTGLGERELKGKGRYSIMFKVRRAGQNMRAVLGLFYIVPYSSNCYCPLCDNTEFLIRYELFSLFRWLVILVPSHFHLSTF